MRRVYLSRDEKRVLLALAGGLSNASVGMDMFDYSVAVASLQSKGLVNASFRNQEVAALGLTIKGRSYFHQHPRLCNPVNWTAVAALGAWVAAAAAIAALLVACVSHG